MAVALHNLSERKSKHVSKEKMTFLRALTLSHALKVVGVDCTCSMNSKTVTN